LVRKIKGSSKITINRSAQTAPSANPYVELVRNNFLYFVLGLVAILLLSGGFSCGIILTRKMKKRPPPYFIRLTRHLKSRSKRRPL